MDNALRASDLEITLMPQEVEVMFAKCCLYVALFILVEKNCK